MTVKLVELEVCVLYDLQVSVSPTQRVWGLVFRGSHII